MGGGESEDCPIPIATKIFHANFSNFLWRPWSSVCCTLRAFGESHPCISRLVSYTQRLPENKNYIRPPRTCIRRRRGEGERRKNHTYSQDHTACQHATASEGRTSKYKKEVPWPMLQRPRIFLITRGSGNGKEEAERKIFSISSRSCTEIIR